MRTGYFAAAAAAFLGAAAPAPTVISLPAFRSVQLNGGGHVTLRHGPQQRVTLVSGSTDISGIEVRNGHYDGGTKDQLVIDACRRSCNGRYDLRVEIVTPNIEAVAINGGGRIETSGAFPRKDNLGVAVAGGGTIDVRSLPAKNVGAAIRGGGRIYVAAQESLGAAINGGGAIFYAGNPKIETAINGGGTDTRAQ